LSCGKTGFITVTYSRGESHTILLQRAAKKDRRVTKKIHIQLTSLIWGCHISECSTIISLELSILIESREFMTISLLHV